MALLLLSSLSLLFVLSPVSCNLEETSFVQRAGTIFAERAYYSTINVTNGGQFGAWTWREMCPEGFYAIGFSLRVEENQLGLDDTALNGIRLFCSKPSDRSVLYTTESNIGLFGEWTQTLWCPNGVLKSFQLRVEPHKGHFGDDTSANNIKFRCSSNPVIEGLGLTWGDYGNWSDECPQGGICGIETKQEPYQVGLDDSALNDVRFFCCS
ncbi:vitelline membrane outer layer protein 1-like [Amia ocellicauda]|uniref:vitelline membrane outer layer protein 1-like n=1 Tax=Amia ocellicauda TaxID=2972642 RepID=UPI003464906D|nr:VMO1 protein [Amia calva]